MRSWTRNLPGDMPEDVEETASQVVDAVGFVRRKLGAGLPERCYQRALEIEFARRGIPFLAEQAFHVTYVGELVGIVRPDFVVDGRVILELKAVEALHPLHEAKLLTYLAVTKAPLGFLVNMNAVPLGNGILRRARTG